MPKHPLAQLIPDPEVLLSMPVEELGLYVLEAMVQTGSQNGKYHPNNFIAGVWRLGNEAYSREHEDQISRALAEALHWIKSTGLIAPVPDNTNASAGWCHLSRRGEAILEEGGFIEVLASTILDRTTLHPKLQDTVWSLFVRQDYDAAIFQAFKDVEVAVRDAAGFDKTQYGPPMMRLAFKSDDGPLTDPNDTASEREALAALFAGSIGSFKNPQSHRDVAIDDGIEAAEVLYLASHLLRIVDRRREL